MEKKLLRASCALAALVICSPAFGQTAAPAVPDSGDIIVTASRTESLLSKTPIAMTAVTGADLANSGITNPTQLDKSVPNLAITRANGGIQITIRGVTSTDATEKGDPSAAFMVNGIYLARPQAQEVSFFDIDRVEVLRGPQGTLYGRNSTAGVVNILSARPKHELGGSIDASYGSFNALNATGVVNVPVSSDLALRLAVNVDRRDNFVIDGNAADGVTLDPYKENYSGRLSALWEPTDALSVFVVADYSKAKGVLDGAVPPSNFFKNIVDRQIGTFKPPTYIYQNSKSYRLLANALAQQSKRDNKDAGIMGEISYDFGPVALTYLGSYRKFDREEVINYANGLVMAAFPGHYWQTSQEIRLALTGHGPFQAQVGGYYFKERSNILLSVYNLVGPNTALGFFRDPTIAENKSVFGQATYQIAQDIKLTGGLRYSSDTKSRVGFTAVDSYSSIVNAYNIGQFVSRTAGETTNAKRTFSKVTWRAGIDYDSPLGLVFASVSTGYKAGGFNDGCEVGTGPGCNQTAAALYYDPETLTAYEAGFKFRISPEARLNATVFHYNYNGLQLSQVANICGPNGDLPCQVTRNAAKAKVDGVEVDANLRPSDKLTVRLAVNYLDAHYESFVPEDGANFAGRPLDRSPKWTWSAGLDYRVPVGEGNVTFAAETHFSSRFELTDLGNYVYFFQPAFTRTDASVTYHAPGDRYLIGVYATNLEDNVMLTSITSGFFGTAGFADPRQFGVRAAAKF